jgi:DNA-binding NarL/FixJ family response regulator
MIKIAIVEDNRNLQQLIVEKISFFSNLQCVFVADNGEDLLEKIRSFPTTQLILMDIEMPKMNGIEATSEIKRLYPHIKVIMLTVFDDDESIFNSILAGADGYLLKEISPDELFKSVTDTMDGGASMTPSIASKTLRLLRQPNLDNLKTTNTDYNLTDREVQVLEQLATGINFNQIANNLFVSTGTIRKHIENIYSKLQVHNKIEAIQRAKLNKII